MPSNHEQHRAPLHNSTWHIFIKSNAKNPDSARLNLPASCKLSNYSGLIFPFNAWMPGNGVGFAREHIVDKEKRKKNTRRYIFWVSSPNKWAVKALWRRSDRMNNRKHGDEQTRSCKRLGQQPKDDLWGHPFVPLFSGCLWGNSVKVAYCSAVFGPAGTSQRVVLWAHPGPWYPWGQSYRSAQLTPFYPTKEESSAQAHRPSTGPLWYQGQQSHSFLHKECITRIRVPLSIPWLHQLWAKRPNWSKIITPALTHFKTTSPRLPILACTQRIPLYFSFFFFFWNSHTSNVCTGKSSSWETLEWLIVHRGF